MSVERWREVLVRARHISRPPLLPSSNKLTLTWILRLEEWERAFPKSFVRAWKSMPVNRKKGLPCTLIFLQLFSCSFAVSWESCYEVGLMERVVRRRKKGTKTLFSISFWDFCNQYQRQQNSLKKIALNRVLSGTVFLKKNFIFPIMFSELRIGPLYSTKCRNLWTSVPPKWSFFIMY